MAILDVQENIIPKILKRRWMWHAAFWFAYVSHIESIEGNIIHISKNEIPIGEQFREQFFKNIGLR